MLKICFFTVCLRFLTPRSGTSFFRMASLQTELSPTSSNRKLILAGQFAFLPTGILTDAAGPDAADPDRALGMNDTQAGNLFLVQFLASLVGVQLSGVLLSRWGFVRRFLRDCC